MTKNERKQAQEVRTTQNDPLQQSGVGGLRGSGRSLGAGQIEAGESNRPEEADSITSEFRKAAIGGIISRVSTLENRYLAYLKAHEGRLRARLNDNLNEQQAVQEELENLKQELNQLLESIEIETEENDPKTSE